jgi:hypothetical protein
VEPFDTDSPCIDSYGFLILFFGLVVQCLEVFRREDLRIKFVPISLVELFCGNWFHKVYWLFFLSIPYLGEFARTYI